MNYWIVALPRPDMERCLEIGTFGMNYAYLLGRVQPGDKIVFIASRREWQVMAFGEVVKGHYVSSKRVFLSNAGVFEHRIDFEAKTLPLKSELDFRTIVHRLSFIGNAVKWGPYFMHAIREMAEKDWTYIRSHLPTKTSS